MPRALRQLLDELFTRTRLERIEARCASPNIASRRVLERAGFRPEGTLKGYFVLHGERVDAVELAGQRGVIEEGGERIDVAQLTVQPLDEGAGGG